MKKEAPPVAIIMGSKSDLPDLKGAFQILADLNIEFDAKVISAHRTPDDAVEFAINAEDRGVKVIICVAGMAAHLGGVIAAHTILPVIGLPMACAPFDGLDALLATVQMPPGIPVASVTVGPAGAKNAALLAISILSLSDRNIADRLRDFRNRQSATVKQSNESLRQEINKMLQ